MYDYSIMVTIENSTRLYVVSLFISNDKIAILLMAAPDSSSDVVSVLLLP